MTWWRTYSSSRGSNVFDQLDLDTLVSDLEQQFSDLDKKVHIRNRLLSLNQVDKVQFYTSTFRKLQMELGDERLDDHTAMHLYIRGLKPFVKQQVLLQRPDSFEATILAAESASQANELFGVQNKGWQHNNPRGGYNGYRGGSNFRGFRGGNNFRGGGRFQGGRGFNQQQWRQQPFTAFTDHPNKGAGPMALGNVERGNGGPVKCYYCGKSGHMKRDCYKFQRDQQSGQGGSGSGVQQQTTNANVQQQLAAILSNMQQ